MARDGDDLPEKFHGVARRDHKPDVAWRGQAPELAPQSTVPTLTLGAGSMGNAKQSISVPPDPMQMLSSSSDQKRESGIPLVPKQDRLDPSPSLKTASPQASQKPWPDMPLERWVEAAEYAREIQREKAARREHDRDRDQDIEK